MLRYTVSIICYDQARRLLFLLCPDVSLLFYSLRRIPQNVKQDLFHLLLVHVDKQRPGGRLQTKFNVPFSSWGCRRPSSRCSRACTNTATRVNLVLRLIRDTEFIEATV